MQLLLLLAVTAATASARLSAPSESALLEYKFSPQLVAEYHRMLFVSCEAGTYFAGSNSTANETETGCFACPTDTYQTEAFVCAADDGEECDYYGVDTCIECPHGSSSEEGSTACVCDDDDLWEFSHDEGGCVSQCDDGTYPMDRDDDGVDDFCAPEYLYFEDYPTAWIEGVDAEVSLSFSGWSDINDLEPELLFAMADGDDCHDVPAITCLDDCSCDFGAALTELFTDTITDGAGTFTIEDHMAGTGQCVYAFVCDDPELYAVTGTFTVFNELDSEDEDECPGLIFDANLVCCESSNVDSCGVCDGSNACAVTAEVAFDFADSDAAADLLGEDDTEALEEFEEAFVAALIAGLDSDGIACTADDITIIRVCVTVLATDVTTCVAGSDMRRSLRNLLQEDEGSVVTVEFEVASSVETAEGGAVDMADVASSINEQASDEESTFTTEIAENTEATVDTNLGAQTAFTGEANNGVCEVGETPEDEPACTTTVAVPESEDSSSSSDDGTKGLDAGAIAGICVSIGVLGLAAAAFVWRHEKAKEEELGGTDYAAPAAAGQQEGVEMPEQTTAAASETRTVSTRNLNRSSGI